MKKDYTVLLIQLDGNLASDVELYNVLRKQSYYVILQAVNAVTVLVQ